MKIEDGVGSGKLVKVTPRNRLDVSSAAFAEVHLVAAKDAQTYLWTSSYSATSGDEIIYVKNTSKTKLLIIDEIILGCVATAQFAVYTATGTAAGTSITGRNTNRTSGNTADVTSLGDAAVTGLTIGDRLSITRVPANDSKVLDLKDAIILGLDDAITITYTAGAGNTVDATILGYYDTAENL
jgi:hypothetical protein